MRILMNTRPSGSARVDSTEWLPAGELRGLTKLVKITEDVRKFAAEQGIDEASAIERGLHENAKEFQQGGAEVYAKT
jgi:phosphomethylpyrimidine synthase